MRPLGNSWLRYSVPVNSGVFLVVPSLHPKKLLFSGRPRIDPPSGQSVQCAYWPLEMRLYKFLFIYLFSFFYWISRLLMTIVTWIQNEKNRNN